MQQPGDQMWNEGQGTTGPPAGDDPDMEQCNVHFYPQYL